MKAKRIALWWPMVSAGLLQELEANGYEIVALIQAEVQGYRSVSLDEFFCFSSGFEGELLRREDVIDSEFTHYFKNVTRLHCAQPGAHTTRTLGTSSEPSYISYDELCSLFYLQHQKLSSFLRATRAEAVWFCRPPHLGVDNLLHAICGNNDVETLVFQQSLFPERFFFGTSSENVFDAFRGANLFHEGVTLDNLEEPNLFYMNKARVRGIQKIREGLSGIIRKPSNAWRLARAVRDNFVRNERYWPALAVNLLRHRSVDLLLSDVKNLRRQKEYLRYKRNIRHHSVSENFIYFPLHLEPEATTSEFGGDFVEQVGAIEVLASVLPSGWSIGLKENPKQNFYYRDPYFYRRIALLANVFWLPSDSDSRSLIIAARAVATITGTVGMEALTRGTPVIYFGNAWYKHVPGAFKFAEDIDIESVVSQAVDKQAAEDGLNSIQSSLGVGVVYESYKANTARNEDVLNASTAFSLRTVDDYFHGYFS